MKRFPFALFGALLGCALWIQPSFAQAPDASRLHADVAWLADDARAGRRSGEPGNDAAAEWIATRLGALGLEPAGASGGYFQAFPIELPARDGGASWLEWDSSTPSQKVRFGVVDNSVPPRVRGASRVVPLFCSEAATLSAGAPLVFGGYGIVSTERVWDDYAGLDLAGCVVLIARGAPPLPEAAPATDGAPGTAPAAGAAPHGAHGDAGRGATSAGWGADASILSKCITAKQRGAIAVLLAQAPAQGGEPLLAFDPGQGGRAGIPCLMVTAAVAADLVPGYAARMLAIDRAGAPLRDPPSRIASRVRLSADVRREQGATRNLLGLLRGSERGRTVVVGAHYDHLGSGGHGALDPQALGQVHNGADDNASGTAAVLEIARLLAAGSKPRGDVLFALWSGEEEGLLGSQHWVSAPTIALADVRANLNLDMVGRAGSGKLQVLGVGTAEPFAAWMEPAGRAAGLELAASLSGQGLGGSDHQSFLARSIPALHLFSGTHTDYHRPSDDTERVEPQGMAKVTLLSLDLIARMQAADALTYTKPVEAANAPSAPRTGSSAWFGSVPDYAFEGPGVRINGTSAGSPAERAGFLPGDVLLRMGDVAIGGMDDFVYALRQYRPGNVVRIVFRRGEREEETRVTLSTRAIQ
jgi:hypothetical protein